MSLLSEELFADLSPLLRRIAENALLQNRKRKLTVSFNVVEAAEQLDNYTLELPSLLSHAYEDRVKALNIDLIIDSLLSCLEIKIDENYKKFFKLLKEEKHKWKETNLGVEISLPPPKRNETVKKLPDLDKTELKMTEVEKDLQNFHLYNITPTYWIEDSMEPETLTLQQISDYFRAAESGQSLHQMAAIPSMNEAIFEPDLEPESISFPVVQSQSDTAPATFPTIQYQSDSAPATVPSQSQEESHPTVERTSRRKIKNLFLPKSLYLSNSVLNRICLKQTNTVEQVREQQDRDEENWLLSCSIDSIVFKISSYFNEDHEIQKIVSAFQQLDSGGTSMSVIPQGDEQDIEVREQTELVEITSIPLEQEEAVTYSETYESLIYEKIEQNAFRGPVAFSHLVPKSSTRLEASKAFASILRLLADRKVTVDQFSSSPDDIFINAEPQPTESEKL